MFETNYEEDGSMVNIDAGESLAMIGKILKWVAILGVVAVCFLAPALVVYCRWGADANADGSVSREEYDANVTAILGTGVLSYLKPVMAFWEKVVFIVLPVVDTP